MNINTILALALAASREMGAIGQSLNIDLFNKSQPKQRSNLYSCRQIQRMAQKAKRKKKAKRYARRRAQGLNHESRKRAS